jgi:LDH2 family malate/lactate/ureidoglycolate dehydrogenase
MRRCAGTNLRGWPRSSTSPSTGAIDPDDFKEQLSTLIDRIKDTPRQPGVDQIRIPGERAFRSREQGLRDGMEIDRVVYEALKSLHLD